MLAVLFSACSNPNKYYKSDCDDGKNFTRVSFAHLIDSIAYYDHQCVEVTGKYEQSKDESLLANDGDHWDRKVLRVDFSPECPLYLNGTRIGFFDYDYNDGKLTPVNNMVITIHGIVNARYKGHSPAYKGAIGNISYIKL